MYSSEDYYATGWPNKKTHDYTREKDQLITSYREREKLQEMSEDIDFSRH